MTTLTRAQKKDLQKIGANRFGGAKARTGDALHRLGLVRWNPGYKPHGTPKGWMLTPKGLAAWRTMRAPRRQPTDISSMILGKL